MYFLDMDGAAKLKEEKEKILGRNRLKDNSLLEKPTMALFFRCFQFGGIAHLQKNVHNKLSY